MALLWRPVVCQFGCLLLLCRLLLESPILGLCFGRLDKERLGWEGLDVVFSQGCPAVVRLAWNPLVPQFSMVHLLQIAG